MQLPVHSEDGTEAGREATLSDVVFGIEPNEHVVWLDVRRIRAAGRQGTHKTKERSDVRGSGRKLYRQKGTGNARAGDAKSPIRQTGGRAHGARPRDYELNLNKKTKRLARRSALSAKAQEEALRVVEDFSLDRPSTRQLTSLLAQLELEDEKVLLLTAEHEPHIYRSSKNVQNVSVKEGRNASTVDVMKADVILAQEGALDALTQILSH
ncbi:MAG: 50S ribosomal protein L4 [Bacteroidetes bacterium SW_4_67_19]|jgi:large subunit ribosomal protein L4|nr:MAG: 50S ribosomal protein L4 [Bacteroidetes bacterium QH_9_67_14]PSQ93577.1 MAG: 50S ribosomal protein L4 [Bacteroidetes bacterium SW_4_67_19]